MAEKSYFYDSTADDQRIYQAADFARFHAQIIGNGVSNTATLPDLEVTARNNMDVALGAGYMFANGYMYENDSTMTLTHDIADPTNDRIDRIVICFNNNPAERRIYAYIKKGIPASSPSAPSITRDNYIHEMSVSQVKIIAGKSHIEQSEITDERANDDVCGYIPLHNIYRGLQIDEFGIVSQPNQSYVEMSDNKDLLIRGQSGTSYITTDIPIVAKIDRQKEIKNEVFVPYASGTYQFYFHISFNDGLGDREKIEAYLVINNNNSISERVYLFNTPGIGYSDLHFLGSGIKYLEAGDEIKIIVSTRGFGEERTSRYRRLSIAKIN